MSQSQQEAGEAGRVEGLERGEVRVRAARREDVPTLHTMISELAAFEGFPDGPSITVDELYRDGFDTSPAWYFALIAERVSPGVSGGAGGAGGDRGGGEVVGYAVCNRAYSSWTARALYVEDLYVLERERRAGVGRKILAHLAQMAVSLGVSRMDWHVSESNAGAVSFYRSLGARDLRTSEGRAALRLDLPCLLQLADTSSTSSTSSTATTGTTAGTTATTGTDALDK